VLTRNSLVLIVPRANPARIHSVYDLRKPDLRLVVAAPSVPVGAYTVQALQNMKLTDVLSNVVSRESDVREVLAKVALGEADAGFVYVTDSRTVAGKVKTIRLPARAQPNVQYGMCAVSASGHKAAAHAFVKRVLSARGQRILRRYGFLPRVEPKH
jgi:molybdate transport system substrate-binding protein